MTCGGLAPHVRDATSSSASRLLNIDHTVHHIKAITACNAKAVASNYHVHRNPRRSSNTTQIEAYSPGLTWKGMKYEYYDGVLTCNGF
jgi:hypothetical protein